MPRPALLLSLVLLLCITATSSAAGVPAASYAQLRDITGRMGNMASSRDWADHKGALKAIQADRKKEARLTPQVLNQAALFNQALGHARDLYPLSKQVKGRAGVLRALYAQAASQAKAACAAGDKGRITAEQIKLQKTLDQAAVEQKALDKAMGQAQKANAWLRANWGKLKALGDKGQRAHELHQRAGKLEWGYFGDEPYYYFEGKRERMKALFGELDQALRQGAKQVGGGSSLVWSIYKSSREGAPLPKDLTPAQTEYARRSVTILAPVIARLKKEPLLFKNSNNLLPTGSPEENQNRSMLDERHTELLRLVHAWQQVQDAPKVYGGMAQAEAAVRQARGTALAAAKRADACYARAERKQKALLAARCPEHAFAQWDPAGNRAACACNAAKGWVWNNDHSDCVPLSVCRKLWSAHRKFAAEGNRQQTATTLAAINRHKCPGQAQLQAHRVVPNVVGMSTGQAARALGRAGLKGKISSAGPAPKPVQVSQVATQSPGPGAAARAGSTVRLSAYGPPQQSQAKVAQAERCDRLGRIFNQAVKKNDLGTAGQATDQAQGCAWQAQAQTWVRCARLAQAYNQALSKSDRRAASQAAAQAKGCDWQGKAQKFLRCHELGQRFDAAFPQAQKSQNLSGLKNILTQARGCYWYDKGRAKTLCLRAGLIFDRNIAARKTQEAGKALAYARQNNCYWLNAGERIYAKASRSAPPQAAPPRPRQQQAPAPRQARRLTPQEECRRMDAIALRACQNGSLDSMDAAVRPLQNRWKQLGCRPSAALSQCTDALVDREISGIFRGWSLGK
ncbi:MAG: PASTA domain-containing protein [Deltaproteobacteria bacterium]|nr:PASTA domain-containing protein [Deltaproteobacteria bacterium]